MKIDELDEWQGLTADMMREWLKARAPRVTLETDGWWQWGDLRVHVRDRHLTTNPAQSISDIAFCERLSVQALLREINPRMRKGWPSDPALAAHSHWMARHAKLGCIIVGTIETDPDWGPGLVSRTTRLDKSRSEGWEFWPCDEYGSKVRWPTDSEGKML